MKLTKQIIKEMVQQELKEGMKRWKIYVKGQSKPFVVGANSSSKAKQLAHMMIKNSSIKIDKVVQEIVVEDKLKEGRKFKYKKNDWKKYNQLVKKGKSVMIQTAFGDEFAWEDGSNYGVFGSESDGREIELSHDDIDQIEVF